MNLICKKNIILLFSLIFMQNAFAFEDCLIMTNGKLNNIKIQHNDIVDVFPLITIMNDKNTLVVHPLKVGETKLSVTKNDKDRCLFSIKVTEDFTVIESDKDGFEILNIDCPPGSYMYYFDIDTPPIMGEVDDFIKTLDEPPLFGEED